MTAFWKAAHGNTGLFAAFSVALGGLYKYLYGRDVCTTFGYVSGYG
jgi:hypothetical protein